METLEDRIKRFLAIDYGYGDGDGDGSGYGDGDGDGSGSGSGDGSGYGYGDGSGYGYGDGYGDGDGDGSGYGSGYGYGDGDGSGLATFKGNKVYYIDKVPTVITDVRGNIARGYIINRDLTTKDCFVAKAGNCFAHGDTSHDALRDAQEKYDETKPLEERIADFMAKYPTLDTVAENKDLFSAHHVLTGSCFMGRQQFVRDHGIDVENGSMTIKEFIELTKDSYGSSAILKLKDAYGGGFYN